MNSKLNRDFPCLDLDQQLYLREHKLTDAVDFLDYYTNSEVHQYILASPPNNLLESESEIMHCRNLFYTNKGIYWSIARKDNQRMIGAIGVYITAKHRRAEICYDLGRDYWGQGIISRAIQAIKNYLFSKRNIQRLEAITLADNPASIKVLEKNGFQHEGRLHSYKFFNNQAYDVEIYALTRDTTHATI